MNGEKTSKMFDAALMALIGFTVFGLSWIGVELWAESPGNPREPDHLKREAESACGHGNIEPCEFRVKGRRCMSLWGEIVCDWG